MNAPFTSIKPATLNEVQLMLLKLFSREMPEQEVNEIKNLLLGYLDSKLQYQVQNDIENKGVTRKDFDNLISVK